MPPLVQNSKLLLICTRHGCNPCTKFGIDQVKGSKDIERTTLGLQTDRPTDRHLLFQKGHKNISIMIYNELFASFTVEAIVRPHSLAIRVNKTPLIETPVK